MNAAEKVCPWLSRIVDSWCCRWLPFPLCLWKGDLDQLTVILTTIQIYISLEATTKVSISQHPPRVFKGRDLSLSRQNSRHQVSGSLHVFSKGINGSIFTTEQMPLISPQQNMACWIYTNDRELFWCSWNRLIYDRKQPWVFVNTRGFSSPGNELMAQFRKEPERCGGFGEPATFIRNVSTSQLCLTPNKSL